MNFSDRVITYFNIGKLQFVITESILSMWIVMLALIVFALIVKIKAKTFTDKPGGFQNVVEFIVESLVNFVNGNMGDKSKGFIAYFGSLFLFLLVANLGSLFGLRPPTANYSAPLGLALITFFMTHFFGVKKKGLFGYLKSLTEPIWLLTPINLIGEIANPISLSFRLFGNIIGGTIIMGLFYGVAPILLQIALPAFLHAYLDLFSGLLQAFIFTMLSMIFVSGAME